MAKKKKDNLDDIPKKLTKDEIKEKQLEEANKFAADYLTQEQIDDLKEIKDPFMAKDQDEWEKVRKKQLEIKNSELYKGKTFTIPFDAMVNVPLSGMFKKAIQDTLNYVFSTMTREALVKSMLRIQGEFKGLKAEDIKPADMAIWTLLNLITEINFQAQEQGKLMNSDLSFGDQITDLIDRMDSDPEFKFDAEAIDRITKDYQSAVPGATEFKFQEEEKEESSDTNEG
jgi:hypothetical protein